MTGFVSELTEREVTMMAIPLRYRIMHRELRWTHHEVVGFESLRDDFDAESIHLGFFNRAELAGSVRLVIRADAPALPSGKYIPEGRRFAGKCGEISKLLVEPACRRRGTRVALMSAAIARSNAEGVKHLFLATLGDTSHYERYGFEQIGTPFQFSDEHITPPGLARLHHLGLDRIATD